MKTASYSICGLRLRIDSEYPLHEELEQCCFRSAETEADVCVTLKSVQKLPHPGGIACPSNPEYPVWREGSWITRCCWDPFRPNPHFCAAYDLNRPGKIDCQIRQECWLWATREKYLWNGIQLPYLLLHHRSLIFHASYVGFGENGILFTAPSGTGKSTQAELWRQCMGADVFNGDKAGVHLGKIPTLCGVPFSGTSGICRNVTLPLKAVVVLSQAPENTVRQLKPVEAVRALCPNVFVDQAIAEEWQTAMGLLLDLIEQVPVYSLACTPDARAVKTLYRAVFGEGTQDERL